MTLVQIEYFIRVAQNLSFTKAAEELYTSQPTVSRQVSLLEQELGFPLLARNKRGVQLTPGGTIMLAEFSKALNMIQEGIQRASRASQGLDGKLDIGWLEGMGTDYFISPPTVCFAQKYPGVVVSTRERSPFELRRILDLGLLDLAFTFSSELPYMTQVFHEVCYPVTPVIAFSRSHPLAEREELLPADFSGETFLLSDLANTADSAGRESELRQSLQALGCTGVRVEFVPNLNSLYLRVRAGRGVALLDTSTACIYSEYFRFIPLPEKQPSLAIVAVWKQDNLNPAIPLYLEELSRVKEIDVFYN